MNGDGVRFALAERGKPVFVSVGVDFQLGTILVTACTYYVSWILYFISINIINGI